MLWSAFCLFASSSFAQTTGLPPFRPLDAGQFDTVNIGNLNTNFAIPIVSTPSRGKSFNLSLVYDSLTWQNNGVGTAWTPVTDSAGNPIWGWKTTAPLGDILHSHTMTSISHRCSVDYYDYKTTETYSGYVYRDPAGTTHAFPAVFWREIIDYCTGSDTVTYTLTGYASDGSGMYINIANLDIPNVWTKSGILLNTNSEDTNGNITTKVVVNSTETDWKDTTGLIAVRVIQNGSNTEYHYLDSTGTDQYFILKRQLYSLKTAFACSGITDYNLSGTLPQVSLPYELDLPNGQMYSFTYEPTPNSSGFYTGRMKQVTLPTGGTIQYTYPATPNNGINCADSSVVNLSRTVSDGTNSATWNYVRNLAALTTTITTPQLSDTPNANDTVYTFNSNGQEVSRKIYANSPGTGTPLRTINTTWATNGTPATQITFLEDGTTQSEVDTNYDSNGLLNSQSEYDWNAGSRGTLLRTSSLTYQTAAAYTSRNMLNLITQKLVKDVNNVTKYRQDINYDESGYVNAPCITGAPQHDDTSYGCSFATRGLSTSIIGYANAAAGTGALTQHLAYDSLGNLASVTDPAGNTTSVSFADNYSDSLNRNSYALPTTVTRPTTNGVTHIEHMSYYYNSGLPYQTTDENSQVSTYSFDLLQRLGSAADPTNATVNFTYTGSTVVEGALNFNSGNSTVDHLSTADALGRIRVQQARQGPGSTNFDSAETDYDLLGRPRRVTTAYSGSAGQTNSTAPATTITYDVLGRPSTVTDAANGTATYTYTKNDVLLTIGPAPAGENTKRRQFEYDTLGRLSSVCELTALAGSGPCTQKSPQTGFWTQYTYDVVGNLIGVTQNSQAGGTSQTRSYLYDGLGRMTSEVNPENGITTYTYDSASGCTGTYSGDLVKRLDNAGNTTCYTYDALHRTLSLTYPSGPNASATAQKYFVYDSATVNGTAMSNAKSRLAEAYTCSSCPTKITDIGFSYSGRGEISDTYESTPHSGGYYHLTQTYWPYGAANQLSGLSGLPTITFGGTINSVSGVDGQGRITKITASTGQNPVTGTVFNPYGTPPTTTVSFGSSDSDVFTFDANTARMTQYKFNIGTTQSDTGTLTWNANSTLRQLAITNQFNSADTQTCTYGYDDLTRLASASCGSAWTGTYSFDPFGNITKSGSMNFAASYAPASNHITLIGASTPTYDSNGNVTNDFAHTYAWDADGNSITTDGVGLTFDALDRMVEQNRSGSYTEIVYAPTGGKLALMNGQSLVKGFVPLPGGATAVYTNTGLDHYRHSDWLGSNRLSSTPSRTVQWSGAYAPWGESYASSGTPDPSFTGQNSDTSSDDYDFLYREYGNQGRWPSPDPAGLGAVHPSIPQSWNRYAYVLGNPLGLIDPLGLGPNDGCTWNPDKNELTCTPPPTGPSPLRLLLQNCSFVATGAFGWPMCLGGGRHILGDFVRERPDRDRGNSNGPANNTKCGGGQSTGTNTIVSGNVTTSAPTTALGGLIGGLLGGPPGAAIGGTIGSYFGVGGTVSWVPSTNSWYAGPTVVAGIVPGGGSGGSVSAVVVPSTQSPNSIATGLSFSATWQPFWSSGGTVTKSPGSGPAVAGFSTGTRIPASGGVSFDLCVHNCGCP